MKKFQIENSHSGVILGVYEGNTPEEALESFAIDAGYRNHDDLEQQIPTKPDEMVVTEVS